MRDKYTPVKRNPQVGELVWLKTNKETSYEGVAYIQKDSPDFWTVINPKDLSQHEHIVIAVDDEYRLLQDELGAPKNVIKVLFDKANALIAEANALGESDSGQEAKYHLYRQADGFLQSVRYLEKQ